MTVRQPRRARAPSIPTPAASQATNAAADWQQQQAAALRDSAVALLHGFEAVRGIQQAAARKFSARESTPPGPLHGTAAVSELALWQLQAFQENLADAARYWQDLAGALLEMQAQIFNSALGCVDTEDVFAFMGPKALHSS